MNKLLLVFVALTAAFIGCTNAEEPEYCPFLHQKEAVFWKGIVGSAVGDIDPMLKKIEAMNLPASVSRCFGSMEFNIDDALAIIGDTDCKGAINVVLPYFQPPFQNDMTLAPEYKKLKDDITAIVQKYKGKTLEMVKELQKYVLSVDKQFHIDNGQWLRNLVSPCIKKQILTLIFRNAIDDGSCCEELKNQFQAGTGHQLKYKYVHDTLFQALDVAFTINDKKETCFYNALQIIAGSSDYEVEKTAQNLLNTPNNEACSASNGQQFSVLAGHKATYKHAVGCCASSLDKFITDIAKFPVVKQYIPKEVFQNNKCIDGKQIPVLKAAIDSIQDQAVKTKLEGLFYGLCIHAANKFSSSCKFYPNSCSTLSSLMK